MSVSDIEVSIYLTDKRETKYLDPYLSVVVLNRLFESNIFSNFRSDFTIMYTFYYLFIK